MGARTLTRRDRENDFSAVGRIGRRTGVTLSQGRIDENGIEEITGIFSSPHEPSPLRRTTRATPSVEESRTGLTTTQDLSVRKSLPGASLSRSASPKKTGINGSARRRHGMGTIASKDISELDVQPVESSPALSPPILAQNVAPRINESPEKSPLRDITFKRARSTNRQAMARFSPTRHELDPPFDQSKTSVKAFVTKPDDTPLKYSLEADHDLMPENGDVSFGDDIDHPAPTAGYDDEEIDQTFEPESDALIEELEVVRANSRKKRKSDTIEEAALTQSSPSQQDKRRKKVKKPVASTEELVQSIERVSTIAKSSKTTGATSMKVAKSSKSVGPASTLSGRQEAELENLVVKIRERPGQQKSLFVLRRETPADDSVSYTRSGRISVKPLAYWRNERCVYGGSPGGASLEDGARFPLNSIKEIIRTDKVEAGTRKGGAAKRKGKGTSRAKSRTHEQTDSDSEDADNLDDPDAEPWEFASGIFRGHVSVWDEERQAPFEAEEEVELAYAAGAIETREVKGSTFRYSKLLSTSFFGTGIVDLSPGGVKRPKNSRRMLMVFFVVRGRVSVSVGPANGEQNTFSVGKGGFWQVPRGNNYAIENVLDRPARVFFSQGCELAPPKEE